MEIYHESDQGFFCDVKPLITTQLVDNHPDHDHDHQNEKSSSPHDRAKLEINFTLFVYNKYYVNLSEEDETQSIAICQHEEPAITATHTIDDVRSLDTELDVVKLFLSEQLYQLKIEDDEWHDSVVEDIIKGGREIGKSDSKKGPKILRLRVDMNITHILELCDICSDKTVLARDALLKKMLKRTKVVADDEQHDDDDDDEEEKKEEGRERKRRRVVRENELCPICMEEFIAGWDEVTCMPCSHPFHEKCIGGWIRENQHNCPVCRFKLPIEHGSQGKVVVDECPNWLISSDHENENK